MDNRIKDSDREPVLAHIRFQDERESFALLNLKQRFERIHQTNLWGAETSVSGLGSEADATAVLRSELPKLLAQLNVTSLLDAPCGDASWITKVDFGSIEYTGVDIVSSLVRDLSAKAHAGAVTGSFLLADLTTDPLPKSGAILCRDCLVHFSYNNIKKAVANFKRSGAEYVITTTFTDWQTNSDIEDGDWRPLNFQHPPFNFPEPVALLNEQCEEAGGTYRDKSLAVWRLDTL